MIFWTKIVQSCGIWSPSKISNILKCFQRAISTIIQHCQATNPLIKNPFLNYYNDYNGKYFSHKKNHKYTTILNYDSSAPMTIKKHCIEIILSHISLLQNLKKFFKKH